MRLILPANIAFAVTALAAYPDDIVQYCNRRSTITTPGWYEAIVHGAVYLAAVKSKNEDLAFQQLAVSHAAHDALIWTFHGTRLYATIDQKLAAVFPAINLTGSAEGPAIRIGREAARKVITVRADDGINFNEPWKQLDGLPGQYNSSPTGPPIPDTPQSRYIRLFGGLGDVAKYRSAPPPSATAPGYEKYVLELRDFRGKNETNRTAYDTETAYYWRESSPIGWNRLASLVVGNKLAKDVVASAKFYAQLNYAIANAGIISWDIKFEYNYWRPITAIRYPGVYLASGLNIYDPDWTPLLNTPNHQDYVSTHATFGAAGAGVITYWNGGDSVDVQLSSNVTVDNVGVITRRITSLKQAAQDNADSRIYGGIHFRYATEVGNEVGYAVAKATLENFDEHWDEF